MKQSETKSRKLRNLQNRFTRRSLGNRWSDAFHEERHRVVDHLRAFDREDRPRSHAFHEDRAIVGAARRVK